MTTPTNVLVIVLDNLGDTVMATAVLRPLKRALPGVRIGFFVKRYAADALIDHSLIDRLHAADPFWDVSPGQAAGGMGAFLSTVNDIRRARYDVVLVLNAEWRRAAAAWAAGIPRRLGYDRRGAGKMLTERLASTDGKSHFISDHRTLVEALAPAAAREEFVPRLEMTPEDNAWLETWRQEAGWAGKDYMAIHPFSGDERKNWPLDRWAELVRSLALKTGLRVAVLCSASEKERLSAWPSDVAQNLRFLAGASLRHVKSVIARARLLIGGDSGPGHMAAALGTPVLSLFGPGDPARSGPVGRGAIDVVRAHPLATLTVMAVETAALKILGQISIEDEA